MKDTAKIASLAFGDLPAEEALAWANKFSSHSAISFVQPLTYAAYKNIPVSYVLCEEDKIVSPEQQNKIIAGLESEMGGKVVDRYSVKSDHDLPLSQPMVMVEMVRTALGETV
jgi:hypothetical protein